jgi:hypothetical protein
MPIEIIILAALGGWTLDDFCGTPPRPWPGPGPGPWWIRKILAAVGGAAAIFIFAGAAEGTPDLLGTVAVGGVGGVFLASLVSGITGRLAGAATQPGV